jgi:hypothetical protein
MVTSWFPRRPPERISCSPLAPLSRETLAPDLTARRAWKGYLFEVLDALEEKGYISQTRRAKSLTLTEAGVERAEEIEERYTAP